MKNFSYIKKYLIHPDDIILFDDNHLLKSLDSLNNSKQDDLELNFEYRRLGIDKKYYWALIYMLKISSRNKLGEKQTHILVAIKI